MPSLTKDSTVAFFSRIQILLLAVASSVILARVLGPSLNGSYRIILLIVNVISLLVTLGLGAANVYFGARDPKLLPKLTGNSIAAAIGLGLLGLAAVELTSLLPAFQTYLTENDVSIAWIRGIVLFLPLMQLQILLVEIIRAKGDIVRYSLVGIANGLVSLAGAIGLVWIMRLGLAGAIAAWLASLTVTTLLTLWLALRAAGGRPALDPGLFRKSLAFGGRLYAGNLAQFLNYRLDIFFIGYFLTPTAVGLYATATALAEMLWIIPHTIRTVLLYHVAARDEETATQMTARVSRIAAGFMGIICLLTALISYPLVLILFGRPYAPAAPALMVLMPGVWALSIGKISATHLAAIGQPEVGTAGALVSLAATVVLDLILIPRWDIIGASTASSISYTLSALLINALFLRYVKLRWIDIFWLRRGDVQLLRRVFISLIHQYRLDAYANGEG